ncbi:Small-conductance mechanosensitive channel [Cognatiyoonia koreensis]|uniref:Small-conductance mechanosensitive channel n=1 Tax=Cognatiyoonia koreensis TaxID=364200 RepID=A0A1I0PBK7_9RHOB|nr:DUF3772 domain-containing protein [Cognatiyoonia koreensis]SEW11688.1 Small-conductance mechanosensitive channel [Cognatiyoonia koreensis]
MSFRHFYWLAVFCGAVLFGMAAAAQDVGSPSLVPLESVGQEVTWDRVAESTEDVLTGPKPSLFRLSRLRDELVTWRDQFANGSEINSGRIATVQSQIAALGPAPEEGDEPAAIAARRSALEEQLADLRAPALLAEESFARANGLIAEVDALIRGRDAQTLTTRAQAPINPVHWPGAVRDMGQAIDVFWSGTISKIRADIISGNLFRTLPVGLLFLAIAGVLLARGRKWVLGLQSSVDNGTARGKAVWHFLLSVWEIILPYLGLLALVTGLNRMSILGEGGQLLLDAVFNGALLIILTRWLNEQFFPLYGDDGPLRYGLETRRKARRVGTILAWLLAASIVLTGLMRIAEPAEISVSVVLLPIQILLGYMLFRFGRLLRTDPAVPEHFDSEDSPPKGRARRFVGILCMGVAIATPVLAAAGFSDAASALFRPSVLTLAILAVVILLQRFVNDLWELRYREPGQSSGSLAPVLIGFLFFLVALPLLAIAWGARIEDLFEIWARFREGFVIGDTRISPSDFITFAAVFAVGFLLTRFIQGTLRANVLPRTKLDLGGQNAVVAGFGYVGIILAAIIAITMAGIDLSSLAIVAGALSVGIGFGLQNIVSNFVSGIILLIERPIGEGDWIEVNGTMGYVRDISVRSTRVETFDRTDVIIPNADLVSGQVTNWTRGNAVGRVIVPVGVAYGTDTQKVISILKDVAMNHPLVLLNPEPNVLFLEFGDSSLNFEIRAILRDVNFVMHVKSDLNLAIEKRFAEEDIEIPFPQRDLWIKNPKALEGGET